MTDKPQHMQRHTAKSDQRFDASTRRAKMDTNNDKSDANNTTDTEKADDAKEIKEKADDDIDRSRLYPKDEIKILKHWGLLKKSLIVGHIVDPLIEKGILTPEKWMKLKRNQKTEQDTVEEFLYYLLKSHHDAYEIFLKALKSRGYSYVSSQLEGLGAEDISPSVSVSSGTLTSYVLPTILNLLLYEPYFSFTIQWFEDIDEETSNTARIGKLMHRYFGTLFRR